MTKPPTELSHKSLTTVMVMLALGVSALGIVLAVEAARAMPRHVSAGQNALRMSIVGEGSPTVVFECFGPASLEIWSRIQPEVARLTRTVSYDHGGFWGSEPGPKPRDAQRLAGELRAALQTAGVPPPYLLVGYSFGGPYVRVFAASALSDDERGDGGASPRAERVGQPMVVHGPSA
jgi:hypothetical protein